MWIAWAKAIVSIIIGAIIKGGKTWYSSHPAEPIEGRIDRKITISDSSDADTDLKSIYESMIIRTRNAGYILVASLWAVSWKFWENLAEPATVTKMSGFFSLNNFFCSSANAIGSMKSIPIGTSSVIFTKLTFELLDNIKFTIFFSFKARFLRSNNSLSVSESMSLMKSLILMSSPSTVVYW